MRWFWLFVWAIEFIAAFIAVPVGAVMLIAGNSDGWKVLLVAVALLVIWAVQYFVRGEDPDPIL